jgi:serine/threonine protein kinase
LELTVLGGFRLESRLGQGGMASVYAATGPDGAQVAAKVMRLRGQDEWKGRDLFERSSKVLRGLQHAQLANVLDFGELEDGSLVLVRERLDGGTLASWVRDEHWRCSPEEFRDLLTSLLGVLEFLHGRVPRVVHRDIKPSNIMFRHPRPRMSADNPPVLVDFDTVAAAPGAPHADGNTVVFSPGYTAPEQLAGVSSPAGDLYSLGMTMVFVATHREPEAIERDDDGRLQLGTALDDLDPACRGVVSSMIAPASRDRPASAAAALRQLEVRPARRPSPTPAPPAPRIVSPVASAAAPSKPPAWRPSHIVAGVLALAAVGVMAWGEHEASNGSNPSNESAPAVRRGVAAPAPQPFPPQTPVPCVAGRGDCDGSTDNDCETDLSSDLAHCGACDHACAPHLRCVDATCQARIVAISEGVQGGRCELRDGGELWCAEGRRDDVVRVELDRPVIAFDTDEHRCAVTDDHRLHCWGNNAVGEAGTGSGRRREPSPVTLDTLQDVTEVALGRHTGCAIAKGRAHCWGSSLSFATLGSTRIYGSKVPVAVRGMDHVDRLASGPMHVCVVRRAEVWCWGDGRSGATGDPRRPQGSNPTRIEGLTDVVDFGLGREHSCALQSTGQVLCWGTNADGQLGDGTHEDRFLPGPVELDEVAEIDSDNQRTCARTTAGQVWCWGGPSLDSTRPTAIDLPAAAVAISMRYDTLVAILDDGRVLTAPPA